ncbi:hypothetical protein HHK36_018813 [Tetracentron sinense]|uniref:Peptide N-acetyl-beta-D-glucosaminyl asparaginase amidase A N-terminal domain-containing protein n=1 Tax=Tetracentron sinense TaxID=13715 RepID=A0A835D9F4_TETSI|nr:hypothetical protein HHK36_018813 [Tetracentron sinense]
MYYFSHLPSLVFLLPFFLYIHHVSLSSPLPDAFFKSIPSSLRQNVSDYYFELVKPLPSDRLDPSCSLLLLQQDFGNTIGSPPVSAPYSPPSDCPGPWTYVVLEFRASCQGEQYDRIAGLWLDGVEILRTSTAEPTDSGIFWQFRKDVTRYSSLLLQSNLTLTVMLENVVNDVFTGVYHVNVSMLYYAENTGVAERKLNRKVEFLKDTTNVNRINKAGKLGFADEFAVAVVQNFVERLGFQSEDKLGLISKETVYRSNRGDISEVVYEKPADLIIPICEDGDEDGFWFRIQSGLDVHSKGIQIPRNTRRAVLEIYVSFHGNDEFWYSNPPDSYLKLNNLTSGRGNGAFRQVFVTIDGVFVGSEVPFPVIFTGGINPLFWEPVVAIGAFDLPSYDLDLTPFLGLLSDGNIHYIGLGVTDSISFWLVDANLHLWLDSCSSAVQAKSVLYQTPALSIERESKFKQLDGSFEIEAKRKTEFAGWVNSTAGNFTTRVSQEFKFKNSIKFKRNGTYKETKQNIKVKTEVRVESDTGDLITRAIIKKKYPLNIITSTLPGSDNDTYLTTTNLSHALYEKSTRGDFSSSVSNTQVSGGWMVVKDHSVLSGTANTHQRLNYKDEFTCYSRAVAASNGTLLEDNSTSACASSSSS